MEINELLGLALIFGFVFLLVLITQDPFKPTSLTKCILYAGASAILYFLIWLII